MHGLIREVIARRRAEPQASWPNDLLSKLMFARDEETGETMTDTLVHDESLGIFVAGHETTARTMSFLWYVLHENPTSRRVCTRSWTRWCRETRRRRSSTSSGFRTRCR